MISKMPDDLKDCLMMVEILSIKGERLTCIKPYSRLFSKEEIISWLKTETGKTWNNTLPASLKSKVLEG